jgi:hypothetical protein
MGADCKSVGLRLPRFESWICHRVQNYFRSRRVALGVGVMDLCSPPQEENSDCFPGSWPDALQLGPRWFRYLVGCGQRM